MRNGARILAGLEAEARQRAVTGEAETVFGVIKHLRMEKTL
jgi:hypothetical protein